eukprot:PhM_4_TR18784/c1_g2_i2/m.21560
MRDFLDFYNKELDYAENVVSLSRPGLTTKASLQWTQAVEEQARALAGGGGGAAGANTSSWYRLAVEDPFEVNLNLGRFVTPLRYGLFRTALHTAYGNGLGYF